VLYDISVIKAEKVWFFFKKTSQLFVVIGNSRTFASAFGSKMGSGALKKEFFERLT